ncbi:unnamed protein product [Hymenolepis diminuta]|uniref:Uncharacterized protein n=1 Tax=Hymenolepis diminuta TaxID=6216 RepID=A0A564Y0L5_HYMDI|nr:unnamed protein product [Hymenolepis diminuta]
MLNMCHLLFFLVVCLISLVHGEDPPSETLIDMNCLDSTCATPFLLGELIVDLPQLSISKGTQAQVIAQSPDFYRIKVGDATYDVPLSFLDITSRIHEERALWRAKLPLIDLPVDFSPSPSELEQKAGSITDPKFDSIEKDFPVPQDLQSPEDVKKEEIADFDFLQSRGPTESQTSNPSPSPLVGQKVPKSNDSGIFPDDKDSQPTPISQNIQIEPPDKPLKKQHQTEEIKVTPTPEIKQQKERLDIESQPKMGKEAKDIPSMEKSSKAEPEVMSVPETKTMQQTQAKVEKVQQGERPYVTGTVPEVTSAPETKVVDPKSPSQKPSEGKNIKAVETGEQSSTETAPKSEEIQLVEQPPELEEVKIGDTHVIEPLTQTPNFESTDKKEDANIPRTPVFESAPQVESVLKTEEKPYIVETSPKVEEAKTLSTPVIKPVSQPPHAETIPKMGEIPMTSAPEVQQPSEQIIDLAPPKMEEVNEIQNPKDEPIPQIPKQNKSAFKLPPESKQSAQPSVENEVMQPESQDAITQIPLSDEFKEMLKEESLPTSPPLSDIVNKSIFFHCLSLAANGTFNGEKSLFARVILSIVQPYFNAAQNLLSKLPQAFVSPLDSLFTFTLKTPLVLFTTWILFIASVVVAALVIKLVGKLFLLGFSSTDTDDPARRSLSEWLAVEENANLLADSLVDKEEAYGRLIVWSTKVGERYENQNRHVTTSSTRVHNQLRDTKAALAESLKENKELKDTHDALVEQLSIVKNEAAFNTAHLREEINTLNKRLEECTRQYEESIAEKERLNEEIISTLHEEKAVLVREVKSYQGQVESAAKTISELRDANQRFEEDLAIRDRELLSVKEAFVELKASELRNKSKKTVASPITPKNKTSEDRASIDGWEVEDDAELDAIIEEVGGGQLEEDEGLNESDLQSAFDSLKEVGRLKVALEEAKKLAHNAASAKDQETKLRVELEEKVDSLKGEMEEMRQELRTANEEREAAKTKLEVLSDYFHQREVERQKDLGRKEFSQSEMSEEISNLREKLQTGEVEINTLRERLSLARRELAETERSNRRHVSELDKRLHENRLASRSLENQVKDLRAENSMLRQKLFVGDRGGVFPSGILPPPPPPPPPQVLTLATPKHPESRSISRQSEKSPPLHPSQVNHHQQQPPFLPFPLAGPGGSQFIPPPPPPLGMMPPSLFNSQIDPSRSVQRPGSATSGGNRSGKHPR